MAEDERERTEQPTSRRREEARKEGNVAVSKEVATFFVVLGGLFVLSFFGVWMAQNLMEFMKISFQNYHAFRLNIDMDTIGILTRDTIFKIFTILLPVMFVPLFGVLAFLIQNGFILTGKPITPDLSKIDPVSGLKKIFSVEALAELLKSILKVSILSYVVVSAVVKEWNSLPLLIDMDVISFCAYTGSMALRIMTRTVWVLAVIALLDYLFQKWSHERSLRMTREEIKEEMKETEGDPLVKTRIKSIQRDLARKRMMQEVPNADVVVTNPVHIAVALKYDRKKAGAPFVVAKGAGLIAEKIKEIAKRHGVPVVENKPLAQSLYRLVDIGKEIPVSLYKAVAELLAYVYRLRSRVSELV